jgi:hypothetical protein
MVQTMVWEKAMKIHELDESVMSEISLGDYRRKATLNQASHSMSAAFGDQNPDVKSGHLHKIAQREKGLSRASERGQKKLAQLRADSAAKAAADREANRESNKARLAQLEKEFDPNYEYSDDHSVWTKHRAIAQQIGHLRNQLSETATAGATSAGNIASVDAPQLSPGKARGKKSYTGSPGQSGTKAPPQPKVVQPKASNGTAKNALDMKGANLFGGGTVKRS